MYLYLIWEVLNMSFWNECLEVVNPYKECDPACYYGNHKDVLVEKNNKTEKKKNCFCKTKTKKKVKKLF